MITSMHQIVDPSHFRVERQSGALWLGYPLEPEGVAEPTKIGWLKWGIRWTHRFRKHEPIGLPSRRGDSWGPAWRISGSTRRRSQCSSQPSMGYGLEKSRFRP